MRPRGLRTTKWASVRRNLAAWTGLTGSGGIGGRPSGRGKVALTQAVNARMSALTIRSFRWRSAWMGSTEARLVLGGDSPGEAIQGHDRESPGCNKVNPHHHPPHT